MVEYSLDDELLIFIQMPHPADLKIGRSPTFQEYMPTAMKFDLRPVVREASLWGQNTSFQRAEKFTPVS